MYLTQLASNCQMLDELAIDTCLFLGARYNFCSCSYG